MFGFWEKIRHRRLRVLLSSYIDGQVSEPEAARVEEHLARCEGCRVELESLRATVGLLSGLPELAVPRSFGLTQVPVTVPSGYPRHLALTTRFATSVAALLFVALVLGDVLGVVTQDGDSVSVQDIPASAGAVAEMSQEAPPLAESAQAPALQSVPIIEPTPPPVAPQAAPAPAAAPPPIAAMAAPAEAPTEDVVAEETADATPPPLERAMVQESEEEKAAAAPVAGAFAVATETVPAQDEAEATPALSAASQEILGVRDTSKTTGDNDGIKMPVWQLEAVAGGLFAVLAISTVWIAIRRRRQSSR